MKKYSKNELRKIVLESVKYLLAQFVLQNLNKESFKFQKLLRIENLKDFLDLYWILEISEKNILKMNVSAPTGKFLKDYEKLWIKEKQQFLKKEDFLPTLWIAIAENLILE